MEDNELVALAQSGDARAFTMLVRHHERSLYAAAYAITRSQWDAADAVQDALADAYVHIKGLRDPARFGAWVSRIVVNECNDLLRKRARVVPMEDPPEPQAFVWDGPEDGLDLMRAVQTLSPDHREVIALRYFRDLKVAEIAEVLGCPPGTVKSRLNRAIGSLEATLRPGTGQEVPR
ncbi:MAG: sigma-70 family RNA polymerase sigma factor [Coriobacteriia bacterium]|nr:sigma-70 family RNA polymerase sigma factor [Coriobacteriia bacterium]MBN2847937.1 sigma-70 family RNA polymerase sigma factor [Coriobacteriia bacterium]